MDYIARLDKLIEGKTVIDATALTLDEWLAFVQEPPEDTLIILNCFPTDAHQAEYLASIEERTDAEIQLLLLNLLVHSQDLVADESRIEWLMQLQEDDPNSFVQALRNSQAYRRLYERKALGSDVPVWEGITWVLDLLPNAPGKAIEALSAYLGVHYLVLPDKRVNGLGDAIEIIRRRYVETPVGHDDRLKALLRITPREFEHVVESLYHRLGYETKLTPRSGDGGRDVIATRAATGATESLRIECKQYVSPIGPQIVRALLGVVSNERATKGVVVTTSRFTKGSKSLESGNARLELINGSALLLLLNEHLGTDWPDRLDRIVKASQVRNQS